MQANRFSEIFGKPNEGIHKYRIFGLASVDLFATVGLAVLLSYYASDKTIISFFIIFILLMISSIYIHKFFGVNTALVKKIM